MLFQKVRLAQDRQSRERCPVGNASNIASVQMRGPPGGFACRMDQKIRQSGKKIPFALSGVLPLARVKLNVAHGRLRLFRPCV